MANPPPVQSPEISVVIPAYNAAAYLPETIGSVMAQSLQNWELLVIDDGSTDDTAAVVSQMAEQDSRIVLISQPNGGVSSARNLGAQKARSELVAFLDADDRWHSDKLKVHVDFMRSHPTVAVSFARVAFIDADGTPTGKLTNNIADRLKPQDFFYSNPTVTTSNMVVRQSIFLAAGGFDPSMQYTEDMDLLLRIAEQHVQQTEEQQGAIAAIDQVLVEYRLHTTGLSSTLMKMEEGWVQLMEKAAVRSPQLVNAHYAPAYGAQLQYLARQTLRLDLPARLGVQFINRAMQRNAAGLLRQPRAIALAVLIYFKWATFNLFKVGV